jgi:hypothetical protein
MADLAVQRLPDGGAVTMVAATAGGDTVPAGAYAGGWEVAVVLVVINAHTGSWVVTIAGQPAVTVPNASRAIIPVRGALGKRKAVTYDGVTALTVGAASLTNQNIEL